MCMCAYVYIFNCVVRGLIDLAVESDHPNLYPGSTGHTHVNLDILLNMFLPHLLLL